MTGVRPETWLNSGANDECRCWPPYFREVAGQDPQQLVQIGADGAVGRLLDSQVFEHRHARGGADAPGRGTQQLLVHPATLRVVGDRDLLQGGAHGVHSVHVRGKKGFVTEVFLDQDRGQSRQAPGVATRLHP